MFKKPGNSTWFPNTMLRQKNGLWIHPLGLLWGGRWCAVATAQPSSSWADARGRGGGCWPPYPLCKIADPVPETKGCRLPWLTNSALVHEPKCGGGGEGKGELRGLSQGVQLCGYRSPPPHRTRKRGNWWNRPLISARVEIKTWGKKQV